MPIPMVPEACTACRPGRSRSWSRVGSLTDEAIIDNAAARGGLDAIEQPSGVDDGGMSFHVLGTDDRLEHLRFDCFEFEPHYHYIDNVEQANIVVRIDTFAEGDPTVWSLRCLRERLPEMLGHAGKVELAQQVCGRQRARSATASTGWRRWSPGRCPRPDASGPGAHRARARHLLVVNPVISRAGRSGWRRGWPGRRPRPVTFTT